jgi:small subunit ribosomal protein S16
MGKIREPYYRIVIADSRTKRDGRAIEEIGKYHPKAEPSLIEVNSDRAQHWLSVGAQPTDPVRKLLEVTGDWQRFKGLPGAEGTLKSAELRSDKKEAFAAALAETLAEDAAAPKGRTRAGKAADAKAADGRAGGGKAAAKAEGKAAEAKAEGKAAEAKADGKAATAKADGKAAEAKAEGKAADAKAEKPARAARSSSGRAKAGKAEAAPAEQSSESDKSAGDDAAEAGPEPVTAEAAGVQENGAHPAAAGDTAAEPEDGD